MSESQTKGDLRVGRIIPTVLVTAIVALVAAVIINGRQIAIHGYRLDHPPTAGLIEDMKEVKRSLEKIDDRLRKIEQQGGSKG